MFQALHYGFADKQQQEIADAVELARQGDGRAFGVLFHCYNAQICTYLARLVGNDDTGRDLAQETFLRAWQSLPKVRGDLYFKAWLYRIATNTARSHLRHERVIRWLPWRDYEEDSGSDLLSVAGPEERAGEAECVRQVLGCLPSQYQVCLLLQLVGGFSQREIAELLEISEKSVSAYVSRGREQFRQLYLRTKGESR
ncbi:MAG: RNA polymerase sigma factor [Ktedonobacteraceae bacterium]|nr:RNA polymerase sigma factor [Chloroflexota bacterium]